jgi:hypothetical protein
VLTTRQAVEALGRGRVRGLLRTGPLAERPAGCQQRRVTPAELRSVLDVLPRARRRRNILETIGDLECGAMALSEIDFVKLCRRYGLPRPDLQERRVGLPLHRS